VAGVAGILTGADASGVVTWGEVTTGAGVLAGVAFGAAGSSKACCALACPARSRASSIKERARDLECMNRAVDDDERAFLDHLQRIIAVISRPLAWFKCSSFVC